MSLLGTDIYAGNSATKVTAAITREDFVFHIAKATEGLHFDDARHDAIRAEVKTLGDVFGSYHFGFLSNNGVDDAHHFLDVAQPQAGELIAGDFENWDQKNHYAAMVGVGWDKRWKYAMDWTSTVLDEAKNPTLLYVNWEYLKGFRTISSVTDWEWWISNPLWLAQWRTNNVQTLPGQFDWAAPHKRPDGTFDGTVEWHPTFHQYISGSTSPSGLDEDWFVGSRADLMTYTIGKGEEPVTAEQAERLIAAVGALTQAQTSMAISVESLLAAVTASTGQINVGLQNLEAIKSSLDTLPGSVATAVADGLTGRTLRFD